MHVGHRLASIKNFQKEVIDTFKDDKDTYFFSMGDDCDMIMAQTRDPRFKASMVDRRYLEDDHPVDLQISDVCDLYAPIADRLLGICASNHHEEVLKRTGTDPTRRICHTLWKGKEAEKRHLSWENFYALRFAYDNHSSRVVSLSWYLSHGAGTSSRTEGGHITSLGNIAMNYGDCDIYAFGHNHQLETWDRVILVPNYKTEKVVARKLVRINTGSWQKSRSDDHTVSYPESRSMKHASIGYVAVEVTVNRNSVDIVPIKRIIL